MIGLTLGLAALLAAMVYTWRVVGARRREARRPGRSEETAIPISNYGEIDQTVLGQRCRCGGQFTLRGEGSRQFLRIVHVECRRCERQRVIYFDVRAVRH